MKMDRKISVEYTFVKIITLLYYYIWLLIYLKRYSTIIIYNNIRQITVENNDNVQ